MILSGWRDGSMIKNTCCSTMRTGIQILKSKSGHVWIPVTLGPRDLMPSLGLNKHQQTLVCIHSHRCVFSHLHEWNKILFKHEELCVSLDRNTKIRLIWYLSHQFLYARAKFQFLQLWCLCNGKFISQISWKINVD